MNNNKENNFRIEKLKTAQGEIDVVRRVDPCLDLLEFVDHLNYFYVGGIQTFKVKVGFLNSSKFYDFTGMFQIDSSAKEFRLIIEQLGEAPQ